MAEAENTATTTTTTDAAADAGAETVAQNAQNAPSAASQTDAATSSSEEPKPFLGDPVAVGGESAKDGAQKGEEAKSETAQNVTQATEADYLKAVVKDEAVFGKDENLQFDQALVKAVVPEAQKLGISPETMGKLANALAKAQVDAGREAMRERVDYFNRMKDESLRKYSPNDFAQINQGIDHWFKPGGVMNNVIRNSELGADPEFLALMHFLGSKRAMDGLAGVGEGGGGASVDPNSTDGLSKMW